MFTGISKFKNGIEMQDQKYINANIVASEGKAIRFLD